MSITPKTLFKSQYCPGSATLIYTAPGGVRTIIDKFTATNTDSGALTLSVFLVDAGDTQSAAQTIIAAESIAAGATLDASVLQNHILNPNDKIYVTASAGSKIVIRASGREVT